MKRFMVTGCALIILAAVPASSADDPVVARTGKRTYTLSDFNRWAGYHGEEAWAALDKDLKQRHALLKRVVVNDIIADFARAQGFDKRPDIREKQAMVIANFLATEYLERVVAATVKASDAEVKKYYELHPQEFTTQEMVRARQILVQVGRSAPEKERTAAREKAEGIRKRLVAGEDFATVAREFSDDPGAKENGGDLGFFPKGKMVPEFETVAFGLKPQEVSGVIETQFGYHLIRVEERRAAVLQPLDTVRERISTKVTRDRQAEAVNEFINNATKAAGMELDITPLIAPAGNAPLHGKQ